MNDIDSKLVVHMFKAHSNAHNELRLMRKWTWLVELHNVSRYHGCYGCLESVVYKSGY